MGPKHGIMGSDFGTDLPEMAVPERDLTAERNAAKFSRTAEYKRLKQHLEARMEFYQTFLPDGRSVLEASAVELAAQWAVANAVITEFKAVINAYEQAKEIVDGADAPRA